MKIELNAHEVQQLMKVLGDAPCNQSFTLMQTVTRQLQAEDQRVRAVLDAATPANAASPGPNG